MVFTGDKNDLCWDGREIFVGKVDSELSLKDDQNPEKWRERGALSLGLKLLRAQFLWGRSGRHNHLQGVMRGHIWEGGVRGRVSDLGVLRPPETSEHMFCRTDTQLQPVSASQETGTCGCQM